MQRGEGVVTVCCRRMKRLQQRSNGDNHRAHDTEVGGHCWSATSWNGRWNEGAGWSNDDRGTSPSWVGRGAVCSRGRAANERGDGGDLRDLDGLGESLRGGAQGGGVTTILRKREEWEESGDNNVLELHLGDVL